MAATEHGGRPAARGDQADAGVGGSHAVRMNQSNFFGQGTEPGAVRRRGGRFTFGVRGGSSGWARLAQPLAIRKRMRDGYVKGIGTGGAAVELGGAHLR